jgi:hypothetical protein
VIDLCSMMCDAACRRRVDDHATFHPHVLQTRKNELYVSNATSIETGVFYRHEIDCVVCCHVKHLANVYERCYQELITHTKKKTLNYNYNCNNSFDNTRAVGVASSLAHRRVGRR